MEKVLWELAEEVGMGHDRILISAKVAGGVEDLIDAEEMGPLTLKGLARPVRIWNVRGLAGPGRAKEREPNA